MLSSSIYTCTLARARTSVLLTGDGFSHWGAPPVTSRGDATRAAHSACGRADFQVCAQRDRPRWANSERSSCSPRQGGHRSYRRYPGMGAGSCAHAHAVSDSAAATPITESRRVCVDHELAMGPHSRSVASGWRCPRPDWTPVQHSARVVKGSPRHRPYRPGRRPLRGASVRSPAIA